MPLIVSKSKNAFNKNISKEVKAGKPVKQAVAIAYSVKRKAGKKKVAKKGKGKLIKMGMKPGDMFNEHKEMMMKKKK